MATSAAIKFSAIVHPPLFIRNALFVDEFSRGLKDLRATKSLSIFGSSWHDREVLDLRIVRATSTARTADPRWLNPLTVRLQLTSDLKFPGHAAVASEVKRTDGQEIDQVDLENIWLSFVASDVKCCIDLLMLSTQVAYSGALQISPSEWAVNGVPGEFSCPNYSRLAQAINHLTEHSVLPLTSLPHAEVGSWLRRCEGLFTGNSNNAVSRAVNLLTHAFDGDIDTSSGKEWVWALAGIEALLNEGGHSTQGQLKEKLRAIFGSRLEQRWLNSVIADVYSFRSNLLHGKKNLPSSLLKDTDEAMNHMRREDIASYFSIGFLVLLIQELIQTKRDEYRFSFALVSPPLPHARVRSKPKSWR